MKTPPKQNPYAKVSSSLKKSYGKATEAKTTSYTTPTVSPTQNESFLIHKRYSQMPGMDSEKAKQQWSIVQKLNAVIF